MGRKLITFGAAVALVAWAAGCDSLRVRYTMREGNLYYKAQKYEDAIRQYEQVLKIRPGDWDATYQIAISYLALYRPGSTHVKDVTYSEKGIEFLEKLLKMKAPDTATVEKIRGYYIGLLQAANKTDKAISYYEELVRQEPKTPLYAVQLAQLYAKRGAAGDFPLALKYFEKRAELEPQNKEAWYTVGVVCWERSYKGSITVSNEERVEMIAKGMKALQRALSLDPEYFDALSYTNLLYREEAKVFQAQGNLEAAQQSVQKADSFMKKALEVKRKQIAAAKAAA